MSESQQIGQKIQAARRRQGWTQYQLGQSLARPRTHAAVSDIERGKTRLNLDEIAEFARVLGMPREELLAIEAAPQPAVMQWEYLRRSLEWELHDAELNELGRDGWELVAMTADYSGSTDRKGEYVLSAVRWDCTFKRPRRAG